MAGCAGGCVKLSPFDVADGVIDDSNCYTFLGASAFCTQPLTHSVNALPRAKDRSLTDLSY